MPDVKVNELLWGTGQRRARGPKPSLGLDEIVRAAVEVADAEGLPAVTMRRVATDLGFTTMALYRHIPGKHELVELMVDTVVAPPPDAEQPTDWRTALTAWAHAYYRTMFGHPWLLGAEAVGATFGPNRVAFMERGLRALAATGLSSADKLAVLLTVTGYTHGAAQVFLHTARTAAERGVREEDFGASFGRALDQIVTSERFPAIADALADGAFDAREEDELADFRFGLDRILDGIAAYVTS